MNNEKTTNSFLKNLVESTTLSPEVLRTQLEELMTLKEIEAKYGNQIRQLPDGRWQARVNGRNLMLTKRENLIKKIAMLEKETAQKETTVENFSKVWLAYRRTTTADATYSDSMDIVNKFLKGSALGKKKMNEVTVTDATTFFQHCKDKKADFEKNGLFRNGELKEKYWNNIRSHLSEMFKHGIQLHECSTNPFDGLSIHRDKFDAKIVHKKNSRYFLREELSKMKEMCYEDAEKKKDTLALGIILDSCTGIRCGELCAIKWRDLLDTPNHLHIQRELIENRDENNNFLGYKLVEHCKTNAGDRNVPLNKEAISVLDLVKKYNTEQGIPCGDDDLIFARIYKKEVTYSTLRCYDVRTQRYCKKMGIEKKSMHDLRRAFATHLFYGDGVHGGMDIDEIRIIMGHSDVSQTMEYIVKKETVDNKYLLEYLP